LSKARDNHFLARNAPKYRAFNDPESVVVEIPNGQASERDGAFERPLYANT